SEGKSGSATTSVANVPVASVVISPVTAVVLVGATVQLTATLKDAAGNLLSGRSVTWASSTPAVATVTSAGLVTGVAPGAATITATSEGQRGTAAITGTSAGPQPGPTDTIIFQDGFESGNLNLWDNTQAPSRYSVTTNAARVESGTRSLEALYTP